jgi:phenylalanyl-tRNA synthetase beta chain
MGQQKRPPVPKQQKRPPVPTPAPAADLPRVTIDDPTRCGRYTARVIKGVRIGSSPDWLVERITSSGGRSINNIVDMTNYIMYELGQPLHAFDLDTLAKDEEGRAHIIVRAAAPGERFTTLDGIERILDEDITCIVDGNARDGAGATIALAGVMGGLDSEVTEKTTDILLESATFSSAHTSRTSRRLQLFSEASARYERIVDAATCDEFSARAAALMVEVAGGTLSEGVVDVWPKPLTPPVLPFRVGRFQDFIGAPIPLAEIVAILTRLGCRMACHDKTTTSGDGTITTSDASATSAVASDTTTSESKAPCHVMAGADCAAARAADDERAVTLPVRPPSYRPDLTREIDLYEEVLRIWGMDRVPSTLPGGRGRIGTKTTAQHGAATIGATLRAAGLNETMTYAFASTGDEDILQMPFDTHQLSVELVNPMSSEQSHMRRTILPGLLRSVAYNLSRGVTDVQLYETGVVFFASEGHKQPRERETLAGVLVGSWAQAGWNTRESVLDFFDGKGVVESLLRELNIVSYRIRALEAESALWLQPGRAAEVLVGSQRLGWLGELHPRVNAAFDITVPVVAFEFDLAALIAAAEAARPYRDVPQFPAVELDLALVVDEEVTAERLLQVIESAGGKLLCDCRLFDVFRDVDRLGADRKSMAFSLSYRAADRTLTLEEVEKQHARVIARLAAVLDAHVRT